MNNNIQSCETCKQSLDFCLCIIPDQPTDNSQQCASDNIINYNDTFTSSIKINKTLDTIELPLSAFAILSKDDIKLPMFEVMNVDDYVEIGKLSSVDASKMQFVINTNLLNSNIQMMTLMQHITNKLILLFKNTYNNINLGHYFEIDETFTFLTTRSISDDDHNVIFVQQMCSSLLSDLKIYIHRKQCRLPSNFKRTQDELFSFPIIVQNDRPKAQNIANCIKSQIQYQQQNEIQNKKQRDILSYRKNIISKIQKDSNDTISYDDDLIETQNDDYTREVNDEDDDDELYSNNDEDEDEEQQNNEDTVNQVYEQVANTFTRLDNNVPLKPLSATGISRNFDQLELVSNSVRSSSNGMASEMNRLNLESLSDHNEFESNQQNMSVSQDRIQSVEATLEELKEQSGQTTTALNNISKLLDQLIQNPPNNTNLTIAQNELPTNTSNNVPPQNPINTPSVLSEEDPIDLDSLSSMDTSSLNAVTTKKKNLAQYYEWTK